LAIDRRKGREVGSWKFRWELMWANRMLLVG
jgi:hypothetical protein